MLLNLEDTYKSNVVAFMQSKHQILHCSQILYFAIHNRKCINLSTLLQCSIEHVLQKILAAFILKFP